MAKPSRNQPHPTGNTLTSQAQVYIERVETLEAEMKEFREGIAADKNLIFGEAEVAGIDPAALKDRLAKRKTQRAEAKRREKMSEEARAQADQLDQLDVLGESFAGTQFGTHIQEFAGKVRSGEAEFSVADDIDQLAGG